jgi:hypothetical protein
MSVSRSYVLPSLPVAVPAWKAPGKAAEVRHRRRLDVEAHQGQAGEWKRDLRIAGGPDVDDLTARKCDAARDRLGRHGRRGIAVDVRFAGGTSRGPGERPAHTRRGKSGRLNEPTSTEPSGGRQMRRHIGPPPSRTPAAIPSPSVRAVKRRLHVSQRFSFGEPRAAPAGRRIHRGSGRRALRSRSARGRG